MVIEIIEDDLAAVLRRKTGAERLKIVDMLFECVQGLIESNVRAAHSDWDERRVSREVAARIAGETL